MDLSWLKPDITQPKRRSESAIARGCGCADVTPVSEAPVGTSWS